MSFKTNTDPSFNKPNTYLSQSFRKPTKEEKVKQLVSRLKALGEGDFIQVKKDDYLERQIECKTHASKLTKSFAVQLFKSNPEEVCQGLLQQKFSPQLRVKLIKIIAKSTTTTNSKWVTDNIAALGVENEKDRSALAKIAAQSFAPTMSIVTLKTRMNLPIKYNIRDQSAVVDIVKIIIKNNPGCTFYLDRLKNIDQKHLTEIIKYSIHCNPYNILTLPKKIIVDKHCMADIFLTRVNEATYPAQVFSWIEFPLELQTLKKVFQLIMGPNENHIHKKPYTIPSHEVIETLQTFAKEYFPDLNLNFVYKIVGNKALSQLEIKILLSNLAWTLELMSKKVTPEQADWIMKQNLLEYTLVYRDPIMRYHLSLTIIQVALSQECRNNYEELIRRPVKHVQLANLFLSQMKNQGVNITETAKEIARQHSFREATNKKLLIETLMCIRDTNQLSSSDKSHLMHHVFKNETDSPSNLYRTLAVLKLDQAAFLKESSFTTIAKAQKLAERKMVSVLFNNEVILENMEKYEELFSRNPSAFFIYASSLYRLPEGVSYKQPLIKCLKLYLESVLDGTFREIRYERVKNKHLQTIFPENAQKLFESWKKGEVRHLEERLASTDEKHLKVDFEEVLRENLIFIRDISSIVYVDQFLKAVSIQERNLINTKLGFAIKQQKILLKEKHPEGNADLLQHLLFAQCLIDLARQKISKQNFEIDFRRKTNEIFKKIDKIYELAKVICPETEFLATVEGLYAQIPKVVKAGSYENWTIEDTDNPQDLILCGTEVIGSCQRVNGNIELTKCLPAYLIDGKNRILVIKDNTGKIRCRAILRILWDNKKSKQVLYMEKIYPQVVQEEFALALNKFAVSRARALNLPLLTHYFEPYNRYDGSIRSLGGPAPFEYVDALKKTTESTFEISDAAILYMPNFLSNSSINK